MNRWKTMAAALIALWLGWTPCGAEPKEVARREMAVTFDDLPTVTTDSSIEIRRTITGKLVSSITRQGVRAIGFVIENKIRQDDRVDSSRVALLRAWLDAGLLLGNHTYSHPSRHKVPLGQYLADVLGCEVVTKGLVERAGKSFSFFRHPYLHTGRELAERDSLVTFLQEHGYRVAPVTIDNSDWLFARAYDNAMSRGDSLTMRRITEAYLPYMVSAVAYYERQSRALLGREMKQILLLHANALNADTFDSLAQRIRERGYRFITLEQALEDEAYGLPDEYVGPAGISWLHRWALTAGKKGEFFEGEPPVPEWVVEQAGL